MDIITKTREKDCICNEYEGKGVSVCGFPCPIHCQPKWEERFNNELGLWIDLRTRDRVKAFISNLLKEARAEERKRLREKIEEHTKIHKNCLCIAIQKLLDQLEDKAL